MSVFLVGFQCSNVCVKSSVCPCASLIAERVDICDNSPLFATSQVLEAQMLPTTAPFYVGLAAAVAMFARRYIEYSGMACGGGAW